MVVLAGGVVRGACGRVCGGMGMARKPLGFHAPHTRRFEWRAAPLRLRRFSPTRRWASSCPCLDLPTPLDQAVHKLWGYASERGRHIRERQAVDRTDAELVVAIAGSLCTFLVQRRS